MSCLRYYTGAALESLRESVEEHLDWYYDPKGQPPSTVVGGVRDTQIEAPELAEKLIVDGQDPPSTDVKNALIVYEALNILTPHQATFEGMWTYLCHNDCPNYVAWRGLGSRPTDHEEAAKKVRNHFFAKYNRSLIRDNRISRLWWQGKIAKDVDSENPQKFLQILLYRQDVWTALIGRPSLSMNRELLGGIYEIMQEHWNNGGALFHRDTFRSWLQALNLRGGVILLDALPPEALRTLLREEAEKALEGYLKNNGGQS